MKKSKALLFMMLIGSLAFSQRTIPAGGTAGQFLKIKPDGFNLQWGTISTSQTLAQTLVFGNTTGANNILISAGQHIQSLDFTAGWVYTSSVEGAIGRINNFFIGNNIGSFIKLDNSNVFFADATGVGLISSGKLTFTTNGVERGSILSDGRVTFGSPADSRYLFIGAGSTELKNETSISIDAPTFQLTTDNGGLAESWIIGDPTVLQLGFGGSNLLVFNSVSAEWNGPLVFNTATPNRVASFNSNNELIASSVTTTELGYVSGVTSGIQAQIDGKEPTITTLPVNKGGTGVSTFGGTNRILYTTTTDNISSITTANTAVLTTNGSGVPSWTTQADAFNVSYGTSAGTVAQGNDSRFGEWVELLCSSTNPAASTSYYIGPWSVALNTSPNQKRFIFSNTGTVTKIQVLWTQNNAASGDNVAVVLRNHTSGTDNAIGNVVTNTSANVTTSTNFTPSVSIPNTTDEWIVRFDFPTMTTAPSALLVKVRMFIKY